MLRQAQHEGDLYCHWRSCGTDANKTSLMLGTIRLTYHDKADKESATGRRSIDDEPEITEAMIEAGLNALCEPSPDGVDSVSAYACFKAMVLAEPRYVRALQRAGLLARPAQSRRGQRDTP